jgi:DNA end-binding protein Ku
MAKNGGARALWTGSISFGLVNIPVRLYTATRPHDVRFHELERKTGQRIHHKRVPSQGGKEVAHQELVKGYEIARGKYVVVEPGELEALEPRRTRTLEMEAFVDLHEIDPIHWDQTYYVGPGEGGGAQKSYELLRRALGDAGKVGIGRFVMRTKEYLATVRPFDRGLALSTMFYADEIRDFAAVVELPGKVAVSPKELALASQLIASLTDHFEPKKYKDTYRDEVMDLIERKARGEKIVSEPAAEGPAPVVDLMEALKASLEAPGRAQRTPKRKPARRARGRRGAHAA